MKHLHKQKDMDPKDIRIALLRQGKHMQAKIAKELGVRSSSVSNAVDGRMVSHRIRQAIAEKAMIDIKRIWPSVYLYGGGPRKRGRPATKNSRPH